MVLMGWVAPFLAIMLLATWGAKSERPTLIAASGWLAILYSLFVVPSVLVTAAIGCSSNPFGYGFNASPHPRHCDNFITDSLLRDYELLTLLAVGLVAFFFGVGILRYAHRLRSGSRHEAEHSPKAT
jgi:hypothetical protein